MNNTWIFEENLILIGFGSYIVVAILEMLLRRFLPLYYFRYGIPIIWRNIPLHSNQIRPLQLQGLDDQVNSPEDKRYIKLQVLDKFEYGLWVSNLKQPSRLHSYELSVLTKGFIKFDKQTDLLKLRVYLNWFAIFFTFLWPGLILLIFPGIMKIVFVILGALVIFIFYHREQEQYFKIWDQACEQLGVTKF